MSDAQQADTPLSQKVQDLDRQISAKVETLIRGVHSQIGERVRAATDDVVRWIEENAPEFPQSLLIESDLTGLLGSSESRQSEAAGPTQGYGALLEAVSRIDSETGQAQILTGLLEESLHFCSRSAFFLIRQNQVRGWAGKGFGEADQRISEIEEKADQDPWLSVVEKSSSLVCSDEQLAGMAIRTNTSPGQAAVLVPFSIRGQIAGVFYADQMEGGRPVSVSGLQLLVHTAAMALETAAVSPGISPCLKLEGTLPEPSVPADTDAPSADETPDAEPTEEPVAVEAEPEPEEVSLEPEEAEEADLEEPATAALEASEESLSKEDLETTVVPAISDEPEGAVDIGAEAAYEALPTSEPTVEMDAPALSLSTPSDYPVEEDEASYSEEDDSAEDLIEPPSMDTAEFDRVALAYEAPVAPEPPMAPEPPPVLESAETPSVEAPPVVDFGDVSPPSEEEIALESEPEPELEDTNAWELEAEEDDDEPTHVGMAAKVEPPAVETVDPVPSPPSLEIPAPQAPAVPEVAMGDMPVGQETVRLPVVAPPAPYQDEATTDPGDETSPAMGVGSPAEPAPQAPAAPEPAEEAPPAAPTSFADPPAAPTSFADPIPPAAPVAPTSFADPIPPAAPAAPTSFADPPPAAPPVAPAAFSPPPAEKPAEIKSSGSSEVRPPSDLEGPGLAFAAAPAAVTEPDAASEALHEEARRLARLLVSEIKLYNEDIIEEGRRTGNIYERLKDDIDRSRQMYEERIDPRLADQEDYFYQELVQRLAGGDASLLGM